MECQYSVTVLPFEVAGFSPKNKEQVLANHPIEVKTAYSYGPRPVAFTVAPEEHKRRKWMMVTS